MWCVSIIWGIGEHNSANLLSHTKNGAAERYEPSVIARYLISLASVFNKFYHECLVLLAEEPEKKARDVLIDMVQAVIKDACGLLGMECPKEM